MINKEQLAAWAANTLTSYTLDVVDIKKDVVAMYEAKGDHDYKEVADTVFSAKDCYIHIRDINTVIGGFSLTRQPNQKKDAPLMKVTTYAESIKPLITDLISAED